MKIIIPMAGEGKRFLDEGYKMHKAVLPMVYRKNGEKCPMVVCAVKDLPMVHVNGDNIAFILRDFHLEDGVDESIRKWYPKATFFSVQDLTEGQACTCLLAESFIDQFDELLIAACDNGIEYDIRMFNELKEQCDMLVFTYRHDMRVRDNPDAFGWVSVLGGGKTSNWCICKKTYI